MQASAMQNVVRNYPKSVWFAMSFIVLLLGIVIFLALADWNAFRPVIARSLTAKTGRATAINGDLRVHIFSWNPSAQINNLTISNPPWAENPQMFTVKRISVSVSLGRLLRGQLVIPQLLLSEPVINLERDAAGRASWELGTVAGTPNGNTKPAKLPTIRSLSVEGGSLNVEDLIRKLRFGGTLVISEKASEQDPSALKLRAKGTLNEKPFSLEMDGGPLLNLTPATPYTLSARVIASDIHLDTRITVQKPFNLGDLSVTFSVTGNDLADQFYLTGLALPNTPPYKLSASVEVSGTTYRVTHLIGRLGSSDIAGDAVVDAKGKRPLLKASLHSKSLNIADLAPSLGSPAPKPSSLSAGSGSQPAKGPEKVVVTDYARAHDRLLPDSALQVNRVRGMDGDVTYEAGSVIAPKIPMKAVYFHLVLSDGVLTFDPLSFVLDEGKFAGSVKIDARTKVPKSAIDMRIDNVNLAQFKSAAMQDAPLSGHLTGRLKLSGEGDSVHRFASTADGAISVIIPHGEINAAIAELTGINVTRGLGLLLTKNETKTSIRCSVMDFQTQHGLLGAQTFFIDTTDVLITGGGGVDLNSEKLNLRLAGAPKHIRLTRLRSPVTVGGTLAHPAIGIDVKKLAGQSAVAAALGTLLTPVAAIIAFVDPGLAKNEDCTAELSQASMTRAPKGTAVAR